MADLYNIKRKPEPTNTRYIGREEAITAKVNNMRSNYDGICLRTVLGLVGFKFLDIMCYLNDLYEKRTGGPLFLQV